MKPSDPLAEPRPWRSGFLLYTVLGLALVGLLLFVTSSQQPPAASTAPSTAPVRPVPAEDVAESLRKSTDLSTCRSVIERLNRQLAGSNYPVAAVDVPALKQLRLADPEIAGVASATYPLLDAPYLEQSLLLSDAAAALGVADLPLAERALAAFEWVCRQVRLRDSADDPYPPHQVLRRGFGTALERTVVFCALAPHLGMIGCFIDCPLLPSGDRRLWLAGALADGQVYLFEPRLGVPLRTADGAVATLEQLRRQPELVNQFDLGGKLAYDVTEEQVKGMTAQPGAFATALAPRMQALQEQIARFRPVQLTLSARQVVDGFQPLAGGELRFFNFTRVLRINYGPDLGGVDGLGKDNEVPRQRRFQLSLIDGRALPPLLAQLPPHGPLGNRVYNAFERPFLEYFQNPQSARELLIRGRYDEATAQLVELRDRTTTLRARLANQAGLEQAVKDWLQAARQTEAELSTTNPQAGIARLDSLWSASEPVQLLAVAGASQSLVALADFDLALIKHEQAERAQRQAAATARPAWQTAAERWQRHRQDYPNTHDEARLHHARALAMLGETDAALSLLANPPAGLDPWNHRAFLLQARLLKQR